MAIKIGDACSMSDPEDETITLDDRQTLISVMDGAVVQDFGHFTANDKIEWTLQFRVKEWEKVLGYWANRELVEVVDLHGNETITARIVIKSYRKLDWFRDKAIKAKIELWRI